MVKAKLISIGNSKGIRLPKTLIEQCKFDETVELSVCEDGMLVSPIKKPRAGWSESFKKMAESHDDVLLEIPDESTQWDRDEWEWEWE